MRISMDTCVVYPWVYLYPATLTVLLAMGKPGGCFKKVGSQRLGDYLTASQLPGGHKLLDSYGPLLFRGVRIHGLLNPWFDL